MTLNQSHKYGIKTEIDLPCFNKRMKERRNKHEDLELAMIFSMPMIPQQKRSNWQLHSPTNFQEKSTKRQGIQCLTMMRVLDTNLLDTIEGLGPEAGIYQDV